MRRILSYLLTALSLWAVSAPVRAQSKKEQRDSLVTLVSAKSAQLIEKNGQNYRKVVGPARFLHNNTYLLCDTALWNVTTNIIDAIGHVQIIQDRTRLSSNTLQYIVEENLAMFRGSVVQLEDKDKNTLRTRNLDYNTQDSVAIFQNGGSMRDKDGQIIESKYGSYDAKASLFVFNDQVNMYMDTTFVKTSRLEYRSDLNTAYFGYGTDMWQDDNMLSANDGWYDRNKELFFFRRDVHLLTKDQETWSDTLYYHRAVNDVELLGKVELMDTTRNVFALAGRVDYTDSLSRVKMTRTPAVMSVEEEKGKRDTTYIGADTLLYRGIKRHVVDSLWKVDADKRLKDLAGDPVTEYRRKAAEAAAKAAEEAAKNNPDAQAGIDRGPEGARPGARGGRGPATDGKAPPAGETGEKPDDPPATKEEPETGETPQDTVAVVPAVDTTQLSFIWAVNHVKLYREDMQMSCDSLAYNDLDSLVRLYRDPLVFNEGNRQYAADSIYVVIRNRKAERARLMSNAFITTQEDTVCFDQIKGTEMMAYFDSTRTLQRFDALGGARNWAGCYADERGKGANLKIRTGDPTIAGLTLKPVAGKLTKSNSELAGKHFNANLVDEELNTDDLAPQVVDVFDKYGMDTSIDGTGAFSGQTGAIDISKPGMRTYHLVKDTPAFYSTMFKKDDGTEQNVLWLIGLRIESLASHSNVTLDQMANAIYTSLRLEGFECPTNL